MEGNSTRSLCKNRILKHCVWRRVPIFKDRSACENIAARRIPPSVDSQCRNAKLLQSRKSQVSAFKKPDCKPTRERQNCSQPKPCQMQGPYVLKARYLVPFSRTVLATTSFYPVDICALLGTAFN